MKMCSMCKTGPHAAKAGFSLIEVMVATALLVMVVGMIGFVFRQSSMSWDSGIRRAEGSTQVRAVVGAIERDLRLAVDAREFGMQQSFSSTSLRFVALLEPEVGSDDRVPTYITFTGGTTVERTAQRLICNDENWSRGDDTETSTLLEPNAADASIRIRYNPMDDDADPDGLPAYVTIQAELILMDRFSGLSVRSSGRDGVKGTKDDIVTQ